ncbi:diguanylate cyclase [uncultured Exiguobacterium sp.]|uniref:GGDEF domain-containing protein n=1 Tax=uncultured Exiguobacterium sp. TaxID=202669 RepID=UPI0025D99F73|nr:GGDEF domain-containing protein [uncultured Exiguobacterium sp.]
MIQNWVIQGSMMFALTYLLLATYQLIRNRNSEFIGTLMLIIWFGSYLLIIDILFASQSLIWQVIPFVILAYHREKRAFGSIALIALIHTGITTDIEQVLLSGVGIVILSSILQKKTYLALRFSLLHLLIGSTILFFLPERTLSTIAFHGSLTLLMYGIFLYLLPLQQRYRKQLEVYQQLAEYDALTGLANRRAWELRAKTLAGQSSTYHLIILDLDQFKQVNDQYGHSNGDAVLEQFAKILERNTRPEDLVARMGGEEFIVLLTDLTAEHATTIAERIRQEVERHTFRLLDGSSIHVTTSIGLSSGKRDIPVQQSMELSDQALYQAKRSGRNIVRIASHLL